MDDKKLEQLREREELLGLEEKELRKEALLKEKLAEEEKKIDALEKKEMRLLGMPSYSTVLFAIAVIASAAIAVYLRVPMLKYPGFYEPDGFYHYSVIRAAVTHNFFVPENLSISGWPKPAPITEPRGLYWVTLFPYFFLRFAGLSYYTVMRDIPVLFALFDMFGAYYLSRFMSRDKLFGALVIALVGLSLGDAARTSALIYRGDGFVAIFLILSLIFFLEIFRSASRNKKLFFMVLSGIALALGNFVWNGAAFATIVYMLSFILVVGVAFILERHDSIYNSAYILGALLIWFVLVNMLKAAGQLVGAQLLTGWHFLVLYAMLAAGLFIAYYLAKNQHRYRRYTGTAPQRLALFAGFAALAAILLWAAIPSIVYEVFIGNGFSVTSAFSATIQELTSPTYGFLFASFGIVLFTTPISLAITASPFLHSPMGAWALSLMGLMPYFFMKAYDTGKGWLGGNARLRFDISEGLLVMVAYMATTAYLQVSAIRFNSLVSVPLAIFSAYTIYWLFLMAKGAWASAKKRIIVLAVGSLLILAFLGALLNYDMAFGMGLAPADSINNGLLSALAWMKNNTASNSVVLTIWPDGSVVEGAANRTSVTDSVGSQNAEKGDAFANWILNSSSDPGFLTRNITGKPDYFLVRYTWLGETDGIFIESGMNQSLKNTYAYVQFNRIGEQVSGNYSIFNLTNTFLGLSAIMAIGRNSTINSYLETPRGISPFSYILFYNDNNNTYELVKQSRYNATNGETILIMYSNQQNSNIRVNITGAFVFQNGIASSNLFKFLYLCGYNSCAWDNSLASMRLVYADYDTKIFKITYNGTG